MFLQNHFLVKIVKNGLVQTKEFLPNHKKICIIQFMSDLTTVQQ